MVHEVVGDLLLTRCQAIAHGVASNDHFDQGLALALREKWPVMAKDFQHSAQQCRPKPGELWTWGGLGIRIYNLLIHDGDCQQSDKPRKAALSNIDQALRGLRRALEKDRVQSLALSRLGNGAGRFNWADVLPLIHTHLGDLNIEAYVYSEYERGVRAIEPVV